MLLLGEDGVVGLQAVLLEELLITAGSCSSAIGPVAFIVVCLPDTLDVEERVLQAEEFEVSGGGHCVVTNMGGVLRREMDGGVLPQQRKVRRGWS